MAYKLAIRRGGATLAPRGGRRHPKGEGPGRRRAALLVAYVPLRGRRAPRALRGSPRPLARPRGVRPPALVALGADHGGYALKQRFLRVLVKARYRVQDVGTHTAAPCDYPRYAAKVARAVASGRADLGVLICKSGAGMAIAANKVPGVRAVVAHTLALARQSRRHNDANVLVLGAVGLAPAKAERLLTTWLTTDFDGGRHARRVRQITHLERAGAQRRRIPS